MPAASARNRGLAVIAIAILLGLGTWALVRYAPAPTGARVGERAPDYRAERLGRTDSVGIRSAFAGHVTVVNIWATWCEPCKREMPSLERLYQAYQARGLRVAATSIDEGDAAPIRAFVDRLGLSFDVLHDRSGLIQQAYQTVGVPETFLLDRQGRITYVALGAEEWDSPMNRRRIELLLERNN